MSQFRRRLLVMMQKVQEIWRDVVMTGTGIVIANDTTEGQSVKVFPQGWTAQVQTSGKNLFDFSNLESGRINISTGALEEHNHTRRLADYIDITDITSYSIYLPGYNKANGAVYVVIYYYDKDKNYLSHKPCGDKIEKYENITPVENAVYIKVTLEQNTIDNPQNIFKVQLEKGAKSTDYEPYTGGKPSPSPEYPQEIKNVGKWNEEKQKYEVDVKVTGKNRFDREKAKDVSNWISIEGDGYLKFPIRAKKGSMITFSYTEKLTEGKKFYLGIAKKETGSVIAWLYHDANLSVSNSKYTIAAEEDYVYLMCNSSAIQTFLDVIQTLQVEISPTQTDYLPYAEQTLTLTSDRPITKWDKLVEQGGEIGWLYNSVNETIDGKTGKWSIQPASKIFYRTDITFPIVVPFCIELLGYDYLMGGYKKDTGITINILGILCITLPEEVELTLDAYKQYLADNPLHVLYKGDSEEFVPLSESEQNAIRALKTYYPTTVISNDQNAFMQIEYRTKYGGES